MKPKVILITQARIGSTRLPEKILYKINNQELLSIHLHRLIQTKLIDRHIIATTYEEKVDNIISIAKRFNVDVYQGSVNDVLDRFYQAAKIHKPDYIVRVTSDCPLLDARIVDQIISFALKQNVDYCSNVLIEDFPDGQDVEVIKFSALKKAWQMCKNELEREHVTGFIIENSTFNDKKLFSAVNFDAATKLNHIRMTVDHHEDFLAIKCLVERLGIERSWEEYTNYIIGNPAQFKNQGIKRNEGYTNEK